MADSNSYVRLKIEDRKRGFNVSRYHFAGHLFVGGDRPVWYRVKSDLAQLCKEDTQENGIPTFDVVTAEEKVAIDSVEENRRLVQLGLLSATVATPRGAQAIDLSTTELAATRGSARLAAVPVAGAGDLTSADLAKK
jgi:hypothetical protein